MSKLTELQSNAFSYAGLNGALSLPSSGALTTIGYNAFSHTDISEQLTIPSSITSIGTSAFTNTCLESVIFNASVSSIPDHCFSYSDKLQHVSIADNVTSIGKYAFSNCENLTAVNMSDNTTEIQESAFSYCSSLPVINLPSNITEIDDDAFRGCAELGDVVLPDGLTTLGEYAFSECISLTGITLPIAITVVPAGAFYMCTNLKKVELAPATTELKKYCFYNCENLEEMVLPDSIKSIGEYAFYTCYNIKNINIPSSIVSIDEYALYNCSSLDCDLVFPETLETIGSWALANLYEMKHKFELPKSITTMGKSVFGNDNNECSIVVDAGFAPVTMDADAFKGFSPYYIENNSDTDLNAEIFDYEGNPIYVKETEESGTLSYSDATDTKKGKYYLTKNLSWYNHKLKDETTKLIYTADETPIEPEILVYETNESTPLVPGVDYVVEYQNNTKYNPLAGTPNYTVKGINKYYGEIYEPEFKIYSDISDETLFAVNAIDPREYTGSAIEIYDALLKYTKLDDYNLSTYEMNYEYSDNTNAGTATIKLTGNEEVGFIGERTVTFTINKADSDYWSIMPLDPVLGCGATIADVSSYLDSLEITEGKFSLMNANQTLEVGSNYIDLKYTPYD